MLVSCKTCQSKPSQRRLDFFIPFCIPNCILFSEKYIQLDEHEWQEIDLGLHSFLFCFKWPMHLSLMLQNSITSHFVLMKLINYQNVFWRPFTLSIHDRESWDKWYFMLLTVLFPLRFLLWWPFNIQFYCILQPLFFKVQFRKTKSFINMYVLKASQDLIWINCNSLTRYPQNVFIDNANYFAWIMKCWFFISNFS